MTARTTPSLLPYGDNSGIPSPSYMLPAPATIEISTVRCQPDTAAVVAAVEMLQQRKLKPDKERIFSYLEKHFPQEVCADPQLVDRLINDALAQSLIVLVNNLDVFSFRTPSKIGRMLRVTKIVAWEGEVPQSVIIEVLRVIGSVEEAAPDSTEDSPKGIGVSVKEILDNLHDKLRLLNYHEKVITQKVMPIAIDEGLAKLLPRQFYTLTDKCRMELGIRLLPSSCASNPVGSGDVSQNNQNHLHQPLPFNEEIPVKMNKLWSASKLYKRYKRDSNGSNSSSSSSNSNSKNNTTNKFNDSDLSPGVKSAASPTSSSRRRPYDDDEDDDDDDDDEEEEKKEEEETSMDHDMEDTTEGVNAEIEKEHIASQIESKEVVNEESLKCPEVKDVSNVPQRVSTRKRFKKSLGPDFVDSSDQMAYYMKESNTSAKCAICTALLTKGKPSIMGRKSKQGINDKQELDKNLIQCSKCELKVHTTCLLLKKQIGSKFQWKCAACGVCSICSIRSKRKEFIISCTSCKRGFHTCCTTVAQTSPDNTTWQCAHCIEPARDESANTISADSAKPKKSLSIKPLGKQITPTIITGNGTIATSKSLLPKASSSTPPSSAKPQLSKVLNSNSVNNYTPKETTLLLPKPPNSEAPASNSLLMPVPMNSQNSPAIKVIRPPTNIIHSNGKKKLKKKIKKNGSEILFRKTERSQNHSESSPTMNGNVESAVVKLQSQKSGKVKKNNGKQPQQSLIKQVEKFVGNHKIKEEVENENDTNHVTVPVINFNPNSIVTPPTSQAPPQLSPSPQSAVQATRKRPRSGPSVKLIFGENSDPELKHNFMAWVSCELKHLVKFDPKPFSSLSSNVPKWSTQDVFLFLNAIGFASSAQFAMDNQVDGMSLLLLRRHDIVTRFPLKLGPALKLHAFLTRIRKEFDLY